jgi:3-hydroxyisobutyrate dehydrogenase-like beta-hydroxyacid dehydrogenase
MKCTRLGERGPKASRIAFGNWSAGRDWGGVAGEAAIAATREALDLGVAFSDTARVYGFGKAEELLGEPLRPEIKSAGESIVIETKGVLRNDGGSPARESRGRMSPRSSASSAIRSPVGGPPPEKDVNEGVPDMSTTQINRRSSSGPKDTLRIAILGTGKMGSAIAGQLTDGGFELSLWNRTRERADALGVGTVHDTPAAAVRGVDLVISSLTGPEAVRSAYLGPDGAVGEGAEKLFIEMSTAGPELLPSLAADVAAHGGRLVDAPILGAPPVLRAGQAAILIGGDDLDVGRATAVLSTLGTVRHVGPLGSGARLKLIANSMLADIVLAAAELQVAGERAGLQQADVFWVLERMAPLLAARRTGIVENRHEPALFALRDLRKDLGLAVGLFAQSGVQSPLTVEAGRLVDAAASTYGDLDISAVVLPYRQLPPTPGAKTRSSSAAAGAPAR